MDFEKTENGSTLTVSLIGELDSMNTPELEEKLIKEIKGVHDLVFDLAKLEYISSAGLRVLLQMQKTMKTQGSMVIKNTNDEVMDIFKVTGFVRLLNLA
ncbi:STAS domain-containing protein [Ruminococcus sp.]|uniref:STAS domain-containing protein n=1 Tax=Ruminococcus sp. TaxID=41978 RepID=UPI00258ED742|nr:STAS domain-containing protein [Ruminococcus sp.]MCR5020631.1 STAS domain-containing protein [Ruminococcus sp.]